MRWLWIAAAGLVVLGCETLIGADFENVRPRQTGAGGSSCNSVVPPDPPKVQNTPGDVSMTVVLTTVDYGEQPGTDGFKKIGWDLDRRCTNQGDPPECTPEAWTGGDPSDGPEGQDNAIGKILSLQETVFGVSAITSADESALMQQGKRAPFALIKISGFTGFSDDEKVRVEWYSSLAFELGPGNDTPKLDGTDAWPVAAFDADPDAGAGEGGLSPSVAVDENAYVTESVLVARFSKVRVPLANVFFEVEDVVLAGRLDPDPRTSTRRLSQGTVGGVSTSDQLLTVVPGITYSVFKVALCSDNPNYLEVKRYVCSAADIPLGAPQPNGVCDGASFGITFETHSAELGPALAVTPPPTLCAPGKDPETDTCAVPVPSADQ